MLKLAACVLALAAAAGCAAPSFDAAGADRPGATLPPVATAVAVAYQGGAFYRVAAGQLEPHLAPGYTLQECAEGLGPTAMLYLTQREYLDLAAVRGPVRQVFLVTCATPPEGYAHPAPVGEPDWYLLHEAADSEAWIEFARSFGHAVDRAEIAFETLAPSGFSFEALHEDGTLLARGALTSPGVPVPAPGLPFACEPALSVGRMLRPVEGGAYAGDWSKHESTCAGAGMVVHPPDGALARLIGPAPSPPLVGVVTVHDAVHSFQTLRQGDV